MLVEREAELAVLDSAVRTVRRGAGSLVLISGDAGSGRSVLLHRLRELAAAEGAHVLGASGAASERSFRFGLARRLLHGLSEFAREPGTDEHPAHSAPAPDAALPPADEDPGADPATVPVSVLHALHALLVSTSSRHAVVLAVDDLHWADDASLRCLAYLIARLRGMRVLIAVVLDPDTGRDRAALTREIIAAADHRVRPGPLSVAATGTLVRDRLAAEPAADADGFAAVCHELTGGHPRDLVSLLDQAAARGLRAGPGSLPLLRALAEGDRRRRLVRALSTTELAADVARAVVVLGEHADPTLVQRLSGLTPGGYEQALRALEPWFRVRPDRIEVAVPDDRGGLAAEMLVDDVIAAVDESMAENDNTRLHLRAAALLHGHGYPPEPVGDQLLLVNSTLSSWGVQRLREAAYTVLPRSPEAAARYLRRALLDLDSGGMGRARLLAELGSVELGFDLPAAIRHITQSVPQLRDTRDRAGVLGRLPLTVAGAVPQVAEMIRTVAAEHGPAEQLEGPDRELALRLEARARYTVLDDPASHAGVAARMAELDARQRAPGAAERELRVVLLSSMALTGSPRAAEVAAMARELLAQEPANSSAETHSVLRYLPAILLSAGAPEGLESWLALAADHARRQRATGMEALVAAQRSLVLLDAGQVAQARRSAMTALDLAEPDLPESMAAPVFVMGGVARRLRDRELSERVLRLPHSPDDLRAMATRRLVQSGMALEDGDPHSALTHLLDCGRRLEQAGWYGPAPYSWRPTAALLRHRLGDIRAAVELAEEEHARARDWGAAAPLGRALRVRAVVTGGGRGVEMLREAVQVLRPAADRLELASALVALGEALQERDPVESELLLAEGGQLAARCGAPWQPGIPPAAHSDRATGPVELSGVLTRGEEAVAKSAALGRTNQEIADELRVSRRAVEKHLTAAYRKLGIDGRADLANALSADHRDG
ncbi:LuxR C-terminal-related transcriptional regulator [Saccharopolyspora gloriosae]|uniref:DNA-binding CsgD family transcriptional regulator n=1 Tax=Saccharopolyspora gloriosae TaxID=455344 RepID=A0A840NIU8_9PSEU|nr:LuxR family transcriptional regulator [Saccharopolyspora gloriosae]MBB5070981.1 DNA-binding CsgD family transcriptional regulator [Saccharopolyspora gloriosae]